MKHLKLAVAEGIVVPLLGIVQRSGRLMKVTSEPEMKPTWHYSTYELGSPVTP